MSEMNPRAQRLIDGFVCVDCGWRPPAGGPIEALTVHCRKHWPMHEEYGPGEVHHRTMAWDAAHDMFLTNREARQWFQTIDALRERVREAESSLREVRERKDQRIHELIQRIQALDSCAQDSGWCLTHDAKWPCKSGEGS